MRGSKAQSSLEYLLTYSFVLLILSSAMAALVQNRPDISVPSQCDISAQFGCIAHTNQNDELRVLMRPEGARAVNVTNATMTYRGNTSSTYCTFNTTAGAVGSSVLVNDEDQVEVLCDLSSLNDLPDSFLAEREEMQIEFRYKESGLTFWKSAQVDIII